MTEPNTATAGDGPLGIICGGGALPLAVADAVMRRGRRVVLFPIRGWVDPADVERYPHRFVVLGQYGRFRRLAAELGCRELVMIGALLRPAVSQIRFDWATVRQLPRIVSAFRGGDDHLLSTVVRIMEEHGFRLLGAHEVAPEILVPHGTVGRRQPRDRDRVDIARGFALIAALGPFDVGQAVVVADNHVLAVEAAEGTDQMLARIAELRSQGRVRRPLGRGVLVKAPKRDQDRRVDLPSIGPQTIAGVAKAGLAGIAVAAGATIIAQPQQVAAAADGAEIFVVGVDVDGRGLPQ